MSDKYKKFFKEYTEVAADANREIGTVNEYYRASQEIGKRQAQDKLKKMTQEYYNHVKKDAIVIFPVGSPEAQEKFAGVAEDEGNTVTIDAGELYRSIAKRVYIENMNKDRVFTSLEAMKARIGINDIFDDLEVGIVDTPTFLKATGFPVISIDDCTKAIRFGVRTEKGDKINASYILSKTQDLALKAGLDGDVVPIVVTNASSEEMEGLEVLAPGKTFRVEVTEENANEQTVIKLFRQIKKKLSGVETVANNQ